MTEFRTEIIRIGPIEKHPNADSLGIVNVLGGYPCIVKLGEFQEGQLATYVPVDSLVPVEHPFFEFLKPRTTKTHHRIKAMKLRGTFSMGLLTPAVEGAMEGEDVTEALGILKYERPGDREGTGTKHDPRHKERRSETAQFERRAWAIGAAVSLLASVAVFPFGLLAAPAVLLATYLTIKYNRSLSKRPTVPIYDLEGLRRYMNVLEEGELVHITEKIHGCNARYIHTGRRFHCSSRTVFRPKGVKLAQVDGYDPGQDIWWKIAIKYDLEKKLKDYPGVVLFGEIYGAVQDLKYGVPESEGVRFMAFDAMYADTRQYMNVGDFLEFCRKIDVPVVPTLYQGPWNNNMIDELAEGKSVIQGAKNIREGFVVRPLVERRNPLLGRVILKYASETYLTRKSD